MLKVKTHGERPFLYHPRQSRRSGGVFDIRCTQPAVLAPRQRPPPTCSAGTRKVLVVKWKVESEKWKWVIQKLVLHLSWNLYILWIMYTPQFRYSFSTNPSTESWNYNQPSLKFKCWNLLKYECWIFFNSDGLVLKNTKWVSCWNLHYQKILVLKLIFNFFDALVFGSWSPSAETLEVLVLKLIFNFLVPKFFEALVQTLRSLIVIKIILTKV